MPTIHGRARGHQPTGSESRAIETIWELIAHEATCQLIAERLGGIEAVETGAGADLREAVALYVMAPRLSRRLFLDATDTEPVSADTVRDTWQALADVFAGAKRLGLGLVVPAGRDARLAHTLIRRLLGVAPTDPVGPSLHLEPAVLGCLAAEAAEFAETYLDPSGPTPDWALIELVQRLTRIIERCGQRATLGWDDDAGKPVGLLYEFVVLIQDLLPPGPRRTPQGLRQALERARMHDEE
jgi:hypothetical protein